MPVAARPLRIPKRALAVEALATAGPPFPLAIPREGIDSREHRRAKTIRGLSLRCPSIYPDFRYRLVLLHQRRAYFDGILLLQEFKTQTPAAGGRIRLGDDVLDFGLLRAHDAAQAFCIDRFQSVPDHIQHE